MSEEEIQQAARECMRYVVGTFRNGKTYIGYFDGTHPFVECIKRGIENARRRKKVEVVKMREARISINDRDLTESESMAIRVAIESFASTLCENGLGEDAHGEFLKKAYLERVESIRKKMLEP